MLKVCHSATIDMAHTELSVMLVCRLRDALVHPRENVAGGNFGG